MELEHINTGYKMNYYNLTTIFHLLDWVESAFVKLKWRPFRNQFSIKLCKRCRNTQILGGIRFKQESLCPIRIFCKTDKPNYPNLDIFSSLMSVWSSLEFLF
ncbi:hypothetical protein CEAn_00632 [Coxiella endosymbiont of Amblyomma nuttalli]|nr:hypothetical protein CEAn_00632 [Coxiella endosymbiont of Amblyomma nuttalli]